MARSLRKSNADKESRWWTPVVGWLLWVCIHVLCTTLRIRISREESDESYGDQQMIFSFWHNRTLISPYAWSISGYTQPMSVLTSASKDGALLASIVGCYGMGNVRGSSHRRGSAALREMVSYLKETDSCFAVTPDGPQGPVYQLRQGVILLASMTGLPIVCLCIDYESCWRFSKSWDKYPVPKPFSRVNFLWSKRIYIPRNLTPDQLAHYTALVEKAMQRGRPDFQPIDDREHDNKD